MALCRGLNEITQQRAGSSSWPLGGTQCMCIPFLSLSMVPDTRPSKYLIWRQEGVGCRKTLGVSGEHSWNGCLGTLQAGTLVSEPGEVSWMAGEAVLRVSWRNQDSIGGLK